MGFSWSESGLREISLLKRGRGVFQTNISAALRVNQKFSISLIGKPYLPALEMLDNHPFAEGLKLIKGFKNNKINKTLATFNSLSVINYGLRI